MFYYKLSISYDGTDFHGWQWQPDKATVAGIILKTFHNVFKTSCKLVGASRTDAGVHALGQIAKLSTTLNLKPEIMLRALNNSLPKSILINHIEHTDFDFSPFDKVENKIYFYHIFRNYTSPLISRFGFLPRYNFDEDILKKSLAIFLGTHDFRSFCTGNEKENTIRTINHISVCHIKRFKALRIAISGPGFLHNMIRRIVGASLDMATKKSNPNILLEILAEKNPNQILYNAPANGLILYKIIYFGKTV